MIITSRGPTPFVVSAAKTAEHSGGPGPSGVTQAVNECSSLQTCTVKALQRVTPQMLREWPG